MTSVDRLTGVTWILSADVDSARYAGALGKPSRRRAYYLVVVPDVRHIHTTRSYACTLPLDEEGERAEEGGGEHEAVGDEDADVHAVVQRELDEDLQRREDELHHDHGRRRLRAVHHHTATTTGPHAATTTGVRRLG